MPRDTSQPVSLGGLETEMQDTSLHFSATLVCCSLRSVASNIYSECLPYYKHRAVFPFNFISPFEPYQLMY
jgi:hypothetical protein